MGQDLSERKVFSGTYGCAGGRIAGGTDEIMANIIGERTWLTPRRTGG